MKMLLLAEPLLKLCDRLENLIRTELPGIRIERTVSTGSFLRQLCQPMRRISVIVVFVVSESDINRLMALKPLFEDIRLILVLGDREQQTMAVALCLNPCFISYFDNDPREIIAVLEKIERRTRIHAGSGKSRQTIGEGK